MYSYISIFQAYVFVAMIWSWLFETHNNMDIVTCTDTLRWTIILFMYTSEIYLPALWVFISVSTGRFLPRFAFNSTRLGIFSTVGFSQIRRTTTLWFRLRVQIYTIHYNEQVVMQRLNFVSLVNHRLIYCPVHLTRLSGRLYWLEHAKILQCTTSNMLILLTCPLLVTLAAYCRISRLLTDSDRVCFCARVNPSPPSAAYMSQLIWSALVQIMACRLTGAKRLSEPMLGYC